MAKNLFLKFCSALLVIATIVACDDSSSSENYDDYIFDVYPVDVTIFLVNENGDNLLDESYKGNLLEYRIEMTYEDETYALGEEVATTRDYMPSFEGLQLLNATSSYGARMWFGEFEGASTYSATMSLYIGNGYTYEIKFDREYYGWNSTIGDVECNTTYYLDGEVVDGKYITIVTKDAYDGMIWDYAPVDLAICIYDTEGYNLLDESVEGNILDQEISITYNDQTYYIGQGAEYVATRDIYFEFTGLTLESASSDVATLYFGSFEGASDYDMNLTLNIGTENSYALRYIRDFEHPDLLEQPIVEEELYIDGNIIEGKTFTIVM